MEYPGGCESQQEAIWSQPRHKRKFDVTVEKGSVNTSTFNGFLYFVGCTGATWRHDALGSARKCVGSQGTRGAAKPMGVFGKPCDQRLHEQLYLLDIPIRIESV
jgi:hypothetical protein